MHRVSITFFAGALLAVGVATGAPAPQPTTLVLTPQLAGQLRLIAEEKAARTPVQRKISSRLLLGTKRFDVTAPAIYRRIPALPAKLTVDTAGRVEIEILGAVTP